VGAGMYHRDHTRMRVAGAAERPLETTELLSAVGLAADEMRGWREISKPSVTFAGPGQWSFLCHG